MTNLNDNESYDVDKFEEAEAEVKRIITKWKNSWRKPEEALEELLYTVKEVYSKDLFKKIAHKIILQESDGDL